MTSFSQSRRAFLAVSGTAVTVAGVATIGSPAVGADLRLLSMCARHKAMDAEVAVLWSRYEEAYARTIAVIGEPPVRGAEQTEWFARWLGSEASAAEDDHQIATDQRDRLLDTIVRTKISTLDGAAAKLEVFARTGDIQVWLSLAEDLKALTGVVLPLPVSEDSGEV